MTGFSTPLRAGLCLALIAQSVHAAAASSANCVPGKEAEALFLTIAPPFVDQVRQRCTGVLPPESYLIRRGGELSQRIGAIAAGRADEAVAAFKRFSDEDGAFDGIDNAALLPMIRDVMGPMIAREIKTRDCAGFDAVLEPLDPLPPENLVRALVAIVQLAQSGESKTEAGKPNAKGKSRKTAAADLDICPLSAAR